MKNLLKSFLIALIIGFAFQASAGVEPVLRNTISGSSLRVDSTRTIEGAEYAASNLGDYNLYKALNYVSLEVNQDQIASCYQDSIYLAVDVEVIGWDENGTPTTDTAFLEVVYNQNLAKEYKAIHTLKLEGYYKLELNILDVSDTNLTQYFLVSGEIAIERYKTLDVGTTPTFSSSSYNSTTGDITVEWNSITGAEEYDLEYTWVDDFDGDGGYLSASSLNVYFKNNATRVTVKDESYTFSNVFEHGYVVFRVRAAGKTGETFSYRIQGPWSDNTHTNSLSDYTSSQKLAVTGLDPGMNWQYVNTFSEWGKRKELISYMDGSFRSRQSITRISSDTTLIVGENIYDYQGRAALQILPVPIDAQKIEYQADFSLDSAGSTNYNKIHFDTGYCDLNPIPLDTSVGASKYYSPSNEFLTQSDHWLSDHNPYIPDAFGYAFTRTIYTPDNSGRVAIQSGVGRDHALGSGHETRMYYGTPFQTELDRLFGNNVGHAEHYQKEMTVDPNGQVSVSYTDLSGKVIATALGGTTPGNVDSLSNNDGQRELEVEIVSTQSSATDPYSLTVAKTINVTVPTEYRLNYILELASWTDGTITDCYECVYNLELSVKDECGAELLDGDNDTAGIQQFYRQLKRVDSSYFATSCPTGDTYYKFVDDDQLEDSIRVDLGVGTYTITKTLSVSQEAAEHYADLYLADTNAVAPLEDFQQYYTGVIDDFGCQITCEECTDMLSDSAAYVAARKSAYVALGYEDEGTLWEMVAAEYFAKKQVCEGVCEGTVSACEYKKAILEADVAPGGQYQEYQGDFTQHPEYCVYDFCTNNIQAFDFQNAMQVQATGDQTVLDGWMNPLKDQSQFPTGVYDTFFYENDTFKENLQARLLNVASYDMDGSTHELNLWEYVTLVTYCQDSTSVGEINGCLSNFDYSSDKCATRSGYAFSLFKAVYLQHRKAALDSIQNANCSITIPSEKEKRFLTNDEIEAEFPSTAAAGQTLANTRCENFCDSSSSAWIQLLGLDGHVDEEDIRLDLVDVCQRGCDGNNPMGAKTVTPANISGTLANSFREVLDDYGVYDPESCNPDLITSIKSHRDLDGDTASFFVTDYSCACREATVNDSCALELNDPALVAAMKEIEFQQEDTTCVSCLTCEQLFPYYYGFQSKYGSVDFDEDSTQSNWPQIFMNFMNDTLDFNLTYYEYEDFFRQCTDLDTGLSSFKEVLTAYDSKYGWLSYVFSSNDQNHTNPNWEAPIKHYDVEPQFIDKKLASIETNDHYNWNNYYGYSQSSFSGFEVAQPQGILFSDTSLLFSDRCACAQLIDVYMGLKESANPEDTADVSEYDDAFGNCGIPDIEWVEKAKNVCFSAFKAKANLGADSTLARYPCNWGPGTERFAAELSWKTGVRFDPGCAVQDCECPSEVGNIPGPTPFPPCTTCSGGPISNTTGNLQCADIIDVIDSLKDEYSWDYIDPDITTWWQIAGRVDSAFAHAPFNRLDYWQDSAYRVSRIKAEISRCIIDDPCLAAEYFDTCSGDYTSNTYNWLLRNFMDELAEPRRTSVANNFLVDSITHMTMGVESFDGTYLYDGGNGSQLWNLMLPDSQTSQGGKPIYITVNDQDSFDMTLEVSFMGISSQHNHGDITRVLQVIPVRESPCDDSTFHFNMLVSMKTTYGEDTFWMMGSTDMYNLLTPEEDVLKLCNNSTRKEVEEDTCVMNLVDMANAMAERAYDRYVDSVRQNLIHRYKLSCINSAKNDGEEFTMRFNQQEYHYTLYYYDQAGNLTETVPPTGVNTLSTAQITQVQSFRETGSGSAVYPAHTLPTYYHYNSLNELKFQATPDGGVSHFWYDRLGRMVVSRNAKQEAYNDPTYSYTLYDALGRITEVGEIQSNDTMSENIAYSTSLLANWISNSNSQTQVTKTYYDNAQYTVNYGDFSQEYLRNRVASTTYSQTGTGYDHAVHYSYDVHGNVNSMVREFDGMDSVGLEYKRIDYEYELVSGNVLKVLYQKDSMDMFFHKYEYDADNRITKAYTSRDQIHWDRDASYSYYLHGPMARTELGELRVQGMDYAYTIQGWIKGVNSERLRTSHDIGKDGNVGDNNQWVCRDVFGFGLGYFDGDYSSIGTISSSTNFVINKASSSYQSAGSSMYNGNISYMVTAIGQFMEQGDVPFGRAFTYDQLNRLKSSRAYNNVDTTDNEWKSSGSAMTAYQTDYSYDANGNILSLDRNGHATTTAMDDITYHYYSGTNRLEYVDDAVSSSNYGVDIDDQSAGNYTYDEIGNLISDASEEIDEIEWTVYGKIKRITRTGGSQKPDLEFEYSPDGHRVAKHVSNPVTGFVTSTWYVRDASGNTMATYSKTVYAEFDTANLIVDTLAAKVLADQGASSFGSFVSQEVQLQSLMSSIDLDDLEDEIDAQGQTDDLLRSTDPMIILNEEAGLLDSLLDNYADSSYYNALLNYYGSVADASMTIMDGCGYTFTQDLMSNDYFSFAEHLFGYNSTAAQTIWDNTFFPTPYPLSDAVAANDLYNHHNMNGTLTDLYDEFYDQYGSYDIINEYINYASEADLENFVKFNFSSIQTCVRNAFSDQEIGSMLELDDRTLMWDYMFGVTDLVRCLNELRTHDSQEFIRVSGVYVPYYIVSEIGDQNVSVYDMLIDIESYYGTGYLNQLKNSLMGMGYASQGWQFYAQEHHIYGSSRVGVHITNLLLSSRFGTEDIVVTSDTMPEYTQFMRGKRRYELSNHLGNVQVVISDKRVSVCDEYLAVDYFEAEVISAVDYYPFGMAMPDRQWYANSDSSGYRYGFNGMEIDDNVKGVGNSASFGFRIYDSRLGKFLSVDPLMNKYPFYSPYHFASNNPILLIDVEGLEGALPMSKTNGVQVQLIMARNVSGDVVDYYVRAIHNYPGGSSSVVFTIRQSKSSPKGNWYYLLQYTASNTERAISADAIAGAIDPESSAQRWKIQFWKNRSREKSVTGYFAQEIVKAIPGQKLNKQISKGYGKIFRHKVWSGLLFSLYGEEGKAITDYNEMGNQGPLPIFKNNNVGQEGSDLINNHYGIQAYKMYEALEGHGIESADDMATYLTIVAHTITEFKGGEDYNRLKGLNIEFSGDQPMVQDLYREYKKAQKAENDN